MRRSLLHRSFCRLTVALPLLAVVAGCGFHPAYERSGQSAAGSAALAQIDVGLIPERAGQLLREELQRRFEGSGGESHKIYLLSTSMALRSEGVGIEFGTTAPSRVRLTASAAWRLLRVDGDQNTVASGFAEATDGYDQIDPQYFYSDLQREQIIRRLSTALADQITLELVAKLPKPKATD